MPETTERPGWLDVMPEAVRWVEEAYPEEGCGLILRAGDGYRFLGCDNLADKYHALDPEAYPRTARTFYIINPIEFVHAADRGEEVAVIVHSHADVGDYFSDEDVAAAVMPRLDPEEPLEAAHPDADYLVISVRDGSADFASLFRFDAEDERGFPVVWRREV